MSQDEALRQLVNWIATELSEGRAKADIESELIGGGVSKDVARDLVEGVDEQYRQAKTEFRRSKTKSTLKVWGFILLGFIALNGVLYGIQEIASSDEKRAVERLEVRMGQLEREIEAIEDRAARSGGVTASEANRYERLINEYNSKVPRYNELAEKAYSRWWLIPVPAPGGSGRAARSAGN